MATSKALAAGDVMPTTAANRIGDRTRPRKREKKVPKNMTKEERAILAFAAGVSA